MKQVIDFVVENYKTIILVAACFLDVILFLVGILRKQKPSIYYAIESLLPSWIKDAEDSFGSGNGNKKLDYVISKVCAWYENETGVSLSRGSTFISWIVGRVEKILETPTKKGK